jgi:hypothetical protein
MDDLSDDVCRSRINHETKAATLTSGLAEVQKLMNEMRGKHSPVQDPFQTADGRWCLRFNRVEGTLKAYGGTPTEAIERYLHRFAEVKWPPTSEHDDEKRSNEIIAIAQRLTDEFGASKDKANSVATAVWGLAHPLWDGDEG